MLVTEPQKKFTTLVK